MGGTLGSWRSSASLPSSASSHDAEVATMHGESGPKAELLIRAAREYRAFHEALHGLNEDHMAEVWLGTWSIREIVAHMTGWHREMTPALERLARGERPVPAGVSYDDVDAWNARFAADTKGR